MYEVNEKGTEMIDSSEFYKQATFLLCSVRDLMNGLQCKSFKIRKIILEFVFFSFGRFALKTVCIPDNNFVI